MVFMRFFLPQKSKICMESLGRRRVIVRLGAESSNKSLQLTFDSPLGLATPSPPVASNAPELKRYAP